MTAAEEYAALKQKRFDDFLEPTFSADFLKGTQLYETKCPSGMVFKYRLLDEKYAAAGGMMPLVVSSQVAARRAGETVEATPAEELANLRASAQMIRYGCVEPRIVVGAVNGHKKAISCNDLTAEDFNHLITTIAGGDGADRLKTFRKRQ